MSFYLLSSLLAVGVFILIYLIVYRDCKQFVKSQRMNIDYPLFVTRHHWMKLARHFVLFFFVTVLNGAFVWMIFASEVDPMVLRWLYIGALLMQLFLFLYLFLMITAWKYSYLILTNRRVAMFEFMPYVRHDVTFVNIDDINEIEKLKRGFWRNLLNYGDVEINMVSVTKEIVIPYVPTPSLFVNCIDNIGKGQYKL